MLSFFTPYTPSRTYRNLDWSLDNLLRETFEPYNLSHRHQYEDTQFKLYETEDNAVVKARFPTNIEKDDIKINIHSDGNKQKYLSIGISNEEKSGSEDGTSYSRSYYNIEKRYLIDDTLYDVNNIQAAFKDGILEIKVPKYSEPEDDLYRIKIDISKDENVPEEDGKIELELGSQNESNLDNNVDEEEETAIVTDA